MSAVLVAGSINMDIVASTDRFPKVGETVAGKQAHFFPGGKGANQAVAAVKSGARTTLIGKLGLDSFGHDLKAFLAGQGVSLEHVAATATAPTGMALITVCDAHNTIVVVPGANAFLEPFDVGVPVVREGDVLVSQLEIPVPTVAAFFARGRAARATTILNPAPVVDFDRDLLDLVDIIVLNETELGALTGAHVSDGDLIPHLTRLARDLQRSETQVVCVTLGRRGAVALVNGDSIVIPGRDVAAIDTTGAGDCFVGALAARLAHGATIREGLEYANLAASICVQRMGAGPSMPTLAEVESAMNA